MKTNISSTILQQLGGNRFIAMTGANDFTGGEYALTFRLPEGFFMRITLNGLDLYDIEYFKMEKIKEYGFFVGWEKVVHKTESDVFCEMLQDIFTDMTGLLVTVCFGGKTIH